MKWLAVLLYSVSSEQIYYTPLFLLMKDNVIKGNSRVSLCRKGIKEI